MNYLKTKFLLFALLTTGLFLIGGCANLNLNNSNDNNNNKVATATTNTNENNVIYVCKKSLGNIYIDIDENQEWHMQLTQHQHLSDAYTYISDLIKVSRCFNVMPRNVVIDNQKYKYSLTVSAKFSESILENLKPVARVVSNKATDSGYQNTAKVAELLMEHFQITDATVSLSFKDIQTDSEIAKVSDSVKDFNSSNLVKQVTAFFMGADDNDVEKFKNSEYYQDENVRKKLAGKVIITKAFINSYKSLLQELIDKEYITADNYVEKAIGSLDDLEPKRKTTTKRVRKKSKRK